MTGRRAPTGKEVNIQRLRDSDMGEMEAVWDWEEADNGGRAQIGEAERRITS